ncbi:glycosyltransferase [Craterilacuibacter sp. RT1T]|uniref:glycosyltransferase n=1 Tax=Craterilacuibacter sp. RT1T TaxID=2942211 RepID=UPI0020BDBA23|nr:glycosyltransferase [Craterilacuibacter sp. RT1T]MCL6263665.1 glycosyltransferase [Craterilacuibacter sp. RT1T]
MKIIFIITGLGIGGAERQVCDLADKFSELGHQVLLISMTGDIINRPRSSAVEIVALKMSKKIHGFIHAYFKSRKLIHKFKPDVVHSHMVHANLFSRLLRLTTSIPRLICTAHSSNEGGAVRMLAYRLTDRLCELSTNVSQEAVDVSIQRKAAPPHRIVAVYNGIDTERFRFNPASRLRLRNELGVSDQTPLLLAVGRLTAAKDYPNLLAAFAQLPITYTHVQLVIIGTGEEEGALKEIVHSLELTGRVHFLGLRQDVNDWMSTADVFVLSSAWEGFGLVVAEAMACERVVVATDCGGVKEVMGNFGILVAPHLHQQLADGLTTALRLTNDEYIKLGKAARLHINSNFSLSAAAGIWLKLYNQMQHK